MRDLFGEVPVSIRDVELWLDRIVNFRGGALRVGYYVLNWNVVEKIRAAKLAGTWEGLIDDSAAYRPFDFVHRRLRLRVVYRLCQRPPLEAPSVEHSRAQSMACFLQHVHQCDAALRSFPSGLLHSL